MAQSVSSPGASGRPNWRRRLTFAVIGGLVTAAFAMTVLVVHPISVRAATCDTSWKDTTVSGNWTDASKWDLGVPGSTSNACLPAGSYTVTIPGASVVTGTLAIGTGVTLALEDLNCNGGGDAVLTTSGDVTNDGTIGLRNSTDGCGGEIHLTVISGSTLTNNGTIDTNGSSRGLRRLTGSVTNNGTLNVTIGCNSCDPKPRLQLEPAIADALFDNRGAVTVAAEGALTVLGVVSGAPVYEFKNDAGGSITGYLDPGNCPTPAGSAPCTTSGAKEGSLIVYGGNTFTQDAGTTSGNPVDIDGDGNTLHFTGSGASTFALFGSNTVSGATLAAGQTLWLDDSGCGPRSSIATLAASLANAGTINLNNWLDACGGTAQVVVPSGSTLSNSGTIESFANRGNRELTGNVTNTGTIAINADTNDLFQFDGAGALIDNKGSISIADGIQPLVPGGTGLEFRNDTGGSITGNGGSGQLIVGGGNTFTEGAGTTSGNAVVIDGDSDTLHFTGAGASTFVLHGSNTMSGSTIAAGQTLYLDIINCGPRSSVATLAGDMTNNGTINLRNPGDACGGTAEVIVPSGDTLTNNGTIQTAGCCRGDRELSGNVTNYGMVEVSHSFSYPNVATLTLDPGTFDNHGTLLVDNDRHELSVVGDTLIAELDGTINLNTTGQYAQDSGATLAVSIDALNATYSGISGGSGCTPCLNLAGTLKVTTLGAPAYGSLWPIIPGTTSGTFSNCPTDGATCAFEGTHYTIHYGSVTLEAAANDVTTSTPSTTTGTVTAIPNTGVPAGSTVYDHATVTGNDSADNPTGSVTFYLCSPAVLTAHSATTCSDSFGTPPDIETLSGGSGGAVSIFSAGETPDGPGTWCFAAYYTPDVPSPYPASHEANADECFLVTQAATAPSAALTRGACAFDLDTAVPGSTFRLIFTPDTTTTYRLAASNPGEFYYNAFATGAPNSAGTVTVTLPYPFVTKGSGFVHVYDAVSGTSGTPACDQPAGNEIPLGSPAPSAVTLSSYGNSPTFASTAGVIAHFTFDSTGLAFVRLHLDYGLKGTTGYTKDAHNNAFGSPTIIDKWSYAFSDSAGGSATGSSENVFKRDPGIGGLVFKSATGDPLPGVTVRIYDGTGKLLGTVATDQDGWYAWTYKFSGKTVSFIIKLPAYNLAQTVTTKSNTFVVLNFPVT